MMGDNGFFCLITGLNITTPTGLCYVYSYFITSEGWSVNHARWRLEPTWCLHVRASIVAEL